MKNLLIVIGFWVTVEFTGYVALLARIRGWRLDSPGAFQSSRVAPPLLSEGLTLFAAILEISTPENSQVHCVLIQAKYYTTLLGFVHKQFSKFFQACHDSVAAAGMSLPKGIHSS
ncbi:hypothetical protein AVEN_269052-1 [Araneus ventricosus]|uniref:Uncharacterized protein n=1 Tax=Araneus ventricosus TaxID=182803 RepID=A0A4Y2RHY0_ARAVE|nr:hypothetical protein AVEN_269052-1 [Araneus ventricosus]